MTGAAGFIGSHLVRTLAARGDVRVVALDDLSGGFRENVPDSVEFIHGSVTDPVLMEDLFGEHRFVSVFHLAAYAAEGLSHFIRRFNYSNNVIGSVNLINQAVNYDCRCFVFTSSIAVYGAGQVPMREDMIPRPEDPYGIAKLAVELDLKAAHEMFGLDFVIFRPHNVYGEFQNIGDRYRNVVGIFMNQILKGEPLVIFGDGEQKRAFSYVGDIMPAMAAAPWTPGARNRIFNVGADTPYSVNELAKAVCRAMGVPNHPIRHMERRNEVTVAYADHASAAEVFGTPRTTLLPDGLARMAEWVRTVGARSTPEFAEIEVTRKLPPAWVQQPDRRGE
ncbi:MAG: NAD-dependent epimerase/dehydratase family protein [Longimicrobiales bacterium]